MSNIDDDKIDMGLPRPAFTPKALWHIARGCPNPGSREKPFNANGVVSGPLTTTRDPQRRRKKQKKTLFCLHSVISRVYSPLFGFAQAGKPLSERMRWKTSGGG
ncbi:MAG: hypothetical protein RRC34_11500 [Lentisphaeria bacterium]|nr:hypothetical protein [Lentisphaeria bacterium]